MEHIYSIGEASEITGISVQSLRKYSNMGLVTPEQVDPSSGYRYYSMNQLHLLDKIKYFRELGMPLAEIQSALQTPDSTVLKKILEGQRERLRQEIAQAEAAMEIADWYLEYLQYPERRSSVSTPYLQHFPARFALGVHMDTDNAGRSDADSSAGNADRSGADASADNADRSQTAAEASAVQSAAGRFRRRDSIRSAEIELARLRHSKEGQKLRYLRQFGFILDTEKLRSLEFSPTAEFMFIKESRDSQSVSPALKSHLLTFPAGDYLCFFANKELQLDFDISTWLDRLSCDSTQKRTDSRNRQDNRFSRDRCPRVLAIEYAGNLRDYGNNLLCEYQLYLGS